MIYDLSNQAFIKLLSDFLDLRPEGERGVLLHNLLTYSLFKFYFNSNKFGKLAISDLYFKIINHFREYQAI